MPHGAGLTAVLPLAYAAVHAPGCTLLEKAIQGMWSQLYLEEKAKEVLQEGLAGMAHMRPI